jgi:hypothetical protein
MNLGNHLLFVVSYPREQCLSRKSTYSTEYDQTLATSPKRLIEQQRKPGAGECDLLLRSASGRGFVFC